METKTTLDISNEKREKLLRETKNYIKNNDIMAIRYKYNKLKDDLVLYFFFSMRLFELAKSKNQAILISQAFDQFPATYIPNVLFRWLTKEKSSMLRRFNILS